ncbi:MAG: GHKL domain-containing protein [Eubacterium sp.]|nr:GHKL domain-containing protein [Eubacterium sp.]
MAVILNIVISMVLYEEGVSKHAALSVMFYAIVMVSDYLLWSIEKRFDPELMIETMMQNSISIYMGTVSQLLQFIVIMLIKRFFRGSKATSIRSVMWIVYLVFPIYSLTLIVAIGYSFNGPINSFQTNVFTYTALSLLIFNLGVYWFIRQEMQRTLTIQKNAIETTHADEIFKLYEQITNERDILGKREHEYKNITTVLYGLATEGRLDEIVKILKAQNERIINNANVVETGNRIITTIINAKYAESTEKGISMRIKLGDLSRVKIDDIDCIIIISNLINNAIEASSLCPKDKRYILIKALNEDGQFIFSIHNSCVDFTDFSSNKNDIVSHGYGIRNAKDAVERNGGNLYMEIKSGECAAVVIIPN